MLNKPFSKVKCGIQEEKREQRGGPDLEVVVAVSELAQAKLKEETSKAERRCRAHQFGGNLRPALQTLEDLLK